MDRVQTKPQRLKTSRRHGHSDPMDIHTTFSQIEQFEPSERGQPEGIRHTALVSTIAVILSTF